jgi:hypothetical protein
MRVCTGIAMTALALAVTAAAGPAARARLPDTRERISIFNDQLAANLSPGQLRFAASHYSGAQKLPAAQVDALKRLNPNFFVLQYRLAVGLGYRVPDAACRPTGDWLRILHGNRWKREWPSRVRERWLDHRAGKRVLHCRWGWYLTNPDDLTWRARFTTGLRDEIGATHTDGAFLDSASVPSYFGATEFSPRLPELDPAFERRWSKRLERFLTLVRAQIGRPVIANAGSWITTRDQTNYSRVDGVMIEGFALGLAAGDWALQLDRALSLVRRGRIVIAQAYPRTDDVHARTFALASYLLVKGRRTFVNLEVAQEPEWFPEYELELGPATSLPRRIADLRSRGAYARRFQRGLVIVNPSAATVTYPLGRVMYWVQPRGGGVLPRSGLKPAAWRLGATGVSGAITLGPAQAAILLDRPI